MSGDNHELLGEIRSLTETLWEQMDKACPDADVQVQSNGVLGRVAAQLKIMQAAYTDALAPRFWACQECGCTDVHETSWVYMNTGENTGDQGPLDECYCPQCEEHVDVEQNATALRPYDAGRDLDAEGMDGDHASALASAGFGTDEDYGVYGDE